MDATVCEGTARIDLDSLAAAWEKIQDLRESVRTSAGREELLALPWKSFSTAAAMLPSQQYGVLFEERLRRAWDMEKVSTKDSRGDAVSKTGTYYEIKVSMVRRSDRQVNVVQVRPGHDVDYFLIAFVDPANTAVFEISRDEMLVEVTRPGWSSAHGARKASTTQDTEYRITFRAVPGDAVFDRWCENYLSKRPVK